MYFRFDTEAQWWKSLEPMPQEAYGYGAVEFQGKIYVAGGYVGGGNGAENRIDHFQCYNPDTDSWSMKSSILETGTQFLIKSTDFIYSITLNGFINQYDVNQDKWERVIQFE